MSTTELKALADELVSLWDNGSFEREDAEQARNAINELMAQLEEAQKCGSGPACCFKESKIESLESQLEDAQGENRALRATEAGLLCRLKLFEDVCRVFDDYLNGPTAWDQAQVDALNDRIGALLEKQQ